MTAPPTTMTRSVAEVRCRRPARRGIGRRPGLRVIGADEMAGQLLQDSSSMEPRSARSPGAAIADIRARPAARSNWREASGEPTERGLVRRVLEPIAESF